MHGHTKGRPRKIRVYSNGDAVDLVADTVDSWGTHSRAGLLTPVTHPDRGMVYIILDTYVERGIHQVQALYIALEFQRYVPHSARHTALCDVAGIKPMRVAKVCTGMAVHQNVHNT